MRRSTAFALALSVTLLFFLQTLMMGQTVTGSLNGQVTDSSGAVLPGAQITLKDQATGSAHTAVSNGSGYFTFTAVFPGTYDVRVTASGFEAWQENGVVLHQNESRSIANIALKPGAASEQVTVEAATETVPMDTGASSTTLNNIVVDQTAIQGRDAAELMRLMPGMAINSGLNNTEWNSALTQINSGPIGQFSASGTQPNGSTQLMSNGSVITDAGNQGTQIANINQDMTQEVTIQDSAFDAEYAHGPVTFSAVGKRGSNAFHGEAYAYTRNGSLNSNNAFFDANNVAKPIDHYWYEGGNIGGPVLPHTRFRDKAFFFAGFEHLNQQPAGTLHQYFVPTQAMMNGDFTAASMAPYTHFGGGSGSIPCADNSGFWNYGNFCQNAVNTGQVTLYDANGAAYNGPAYIAADNCVSSNHASGCTSPAVSGATISAAAMDPNGQALLKLLNGAPGLQMIAPTKGYNAQFLDRPPVNGNELNLRGDVNITEKQKAFVSFTRQTEADINSIGVWWWQPASLPYPSQMPANQVSKSYSFGLTSTLSPTMVNEATFGYAYFINPVSLANPTAANPASAGYNVTTPYASPVPQVPNIVSWCCAPGGGGNAQSATPSAGFQAPSFGSNPTWYGKDFGKDSYTPDFSDNFTIVKGPHTLKAGFFWARYANVQTEGCCGGGTVGQWDFDPYANASTGNIYADMLTGQANSFSQGSQNFTDNVVYNEYSFFVQDRWQAMRRLTLSFGVRFNHEGQWYPTNENQGIMVWDPTNSANPLTGTGTLPGFVWHGNDSKIPVSGWTTHSFYPDPHVGVAFDVFGNGKTVLRGGFGVYRFNVAYNDVTEQNMLDGPLGLKSFASNCVFNNLSDLSTCGAAAAASISSQSYGGMLPGDNKVPYTDNWNVMISQRAPWKSTFELAYKGNRTRDMLLSANGGGGVDINNINYITPGGLFKPDPANGITYFCQGAASTTCVSGGPPSLTPYRTLPYTAVYLFSHGSYSNYNGMVAQWIKQTGRAVFTLNYTWSHALGIRDGNNDNNQGSGAALDAFHLANNYGTLAFNRFHIFNASYVINLPGSFHNSVLSQVANGWKLSGVTQYQTGPPLQPLTGTGLNPNWGPMSNQSMLGTDGIALEPVLVCDPSKHLAHGQYFNPNCFQAPSKQGVNGQLIWPDIHAPAFFDSDLGVYKDFKVTERQKLEFRFTAFNFLNHPLKQFGLGNDVNLTFAAPGGVNTNTKGTTACPTCYTSGYPAYEVGNRSLEFALKYYF
ncbi:MAG TPA: carboxypeptidase-like regulatory domain-containing protein [Terriglobales bacterium]|nr:carboxypeptidase-like regulatory domain-containing protein [Terriglobales bacterium]